MTAQAAAGVSADTRPEVLGVTDLMQHFEVSAPWTARFGKGTAPEPVKAVDGVSLSLARARRSAWWASPAAASRR